jgi:hypothetical protein
MTVAAAVRRLALGALWMMLVAAAFLAIDLYT